jgi:membrane-associated phospholipid phosphatase
MSLIVYIGVPKNRALDDHQEAWIMKGVDACIRKTKEFYLRHEKTVLFILLILFFLVPYMLINAAMAGKPALNLSIRLDAIFPLIPAFIIVYLSAYVQAVMPYFVLTEIRTVRKGALVYFIAIGVAYIVFLLLPGKIDRPILIGTDIFSWILAKAYLIDKPYNMFPSLHVALSFIPAFLCFRVNRRYWFMFPWSITIALSTLLVKQHYIVDVFAGFFLACATYFIVFYVRWKKKDDIPA